METKTLLRAAVIAGLCVLPLRNFAETTEEQKASEFSKSGTALSYTEFLKCSSLVTDFAVIVSGKKVLTINGINFSAPEYPRKPEDVKIKLQTQDGKNWTAKWVEDK